MYLSKCSCYIRNTLRQVRMSLPRKILPSSIHPWILSDKLSGREACQRAPQCVAETLQWVSVKVVEAYSFGKWRSNIIKDYFLVREVLSGIDWCQYCDPIKSIGYSDTICAVNQCYRHETIDWYVIQHQCFLFLILKPFFTNTAGNYLKVSWKYPVDLYSRFWIYWRQFFHQNTKNCGQLTHGLLQCPHSSTSTRS